MDEKAIILAAGKGSRLKPLTDYLPKCMLTIEGKTIIERIINPILNAGIREIVVVTGHQHEKLSEFLNKMYSNIKVIYNEKYDSTDNIYSLWTARNELLKGFVLFDSDTLFEESVLKKIMDFNGNAILVDSSTPMTPDSMRVDYREDKILKLSKGLDSKMAGSINISKICKENTKSFIDFLDKMIRGGHEKKYYEDVFSKLIEAAYEIHALDIKNLFWREIDTKKDLDEIREYFRKRNLSY